MSQNPVSYKRHRYPASVIAQAVWLYFRFPLSLRLVEEMLLERGIVVSYGRSGVGRRSGPRERVMQRFRSPCALQRFASILSAVRNLFVPTSSKHSAIALHLYRLEAMAHWKAVTGTAA